MLRLWNTYIIKHRLKVNNRFPFCITKLFLTRIRTHCKVTAMSTSNTAIVSPLIVIRSWTSTSTHKELFNNLYQSPSITAINRRMMGGTSRQLLRSNTH